MVMPSWEKDRKFDNKVIKPANLRHNKFCDADPKGIDCQHFLQAVKSLPSILTFTVPFPFLLRSVKKPDR